MPSVLYAGPEGKRLTRKAPPRRVILSVTTELFEYELQLGLPASGPPGASLFLSDPEVKEEFIRGRHSVVVAGTHGKTTTTSLVAWVLDRAGLNPVS